MNEKGIVGQITPDLLSDNEWVAAILMVCFFISAYVLSQGKALLFQSIRKLFSNHAIEHLFHKQTATDTYCLLLLNLQTCLLVAVLILKYRYDIQASEIANNLPSSTVSVLLGSYSGLMLLYVIVKRYTYKFINWIFFDKTKNSLWIESYFFIISIFGMLLLPFTLLTIYYDFPFYTGFIIPVFLFFLMNLLFIYKCFSIFFNQLHGSFYLFLYFCTLEVLPFLVVWKGIEMVNDILL